MQSTSIIMSRELYSQLKRVKIFRALVHFFRNLLHFFRYACFWKPYSVFFKRKSGLEVGGPSDIFAPLYFKCASCDGVNFQENTVWWKKENSSEYRYRSVKLGKVYIADAVDMSCLSDDTYDFVLSSNNLEHIANPLKALKEFVRVLKNGGILVVIVPDKKYTFDHRREFTSFEHMLNDYEKGTEETDLTHLPEILQLHDYDKDPLCGGSEAFKKRSELNYENRCLHHHVFSENSLIKLFEYLRLKIINTSACFGNYIIIGKK